MRRSLRTELLFSHLSLVALMLLILLASVGGFFRLGGYVDRILRDNYKSVVVAQEMKDALERQDSAATFYLAGQRDRARTQYATNRARFEKALAEESGNVTEVGEQELVDEITVRYALYRKHLDQLFAGSRDDNAARAFYFRTLENEFLRLKETAQGILDLNQRAILAADKQARAEANRSAVLAAVVAGGAIVLAVLLTYRTVNSLMTPVVSLTRQAEEVGNGHLIQRVDVRRDDEIGLLARSFNEMAERLNEARRVAADRLHLAERMSDAALANLYDPVIVSDAAGRVVHLNRAAEGLFGPDATAKGRDVGLVVRNKRLYDALLRAIGTQETSANEGDAALTTLGGRTYRLRATPMRDEGGDDKILGAVAVLEDVTYQEEVNRLKTEFIGVASHELRTPVTSLLLGVQLLSEGAAGDLTAEQSAIAGALCEDLSRLDRMTHDLLDITRLEAGVTPPRFALTKPGELITGAVRNMLAQADEKKVRLVADTPPALPVIRADRGQIERVLTNLLSNAVRHTPAGGEVRVSAERLADAVRFVVSDNGSGIPPEHLPRIWERFVQVPGATRGGAGLGLSLVKNIVAAHGGTVDAESTLGRGSRFSFLLPIAGKENEL